MAADRALFDTSAVIAMAAGNDAVPLPGEVAISAVTLCGLHHGALVAGDRDRAGRLAVLAFAERTFAPLAVDATVAPHYGRLAQAAAAMGKKARPRLGDMLIAATAAAHGLPLYTADAEQARVAAAAGLEAVEV